MKNAKWLALIAAVTLPLLGASAQTPAGQAPAELSPGATEVVKLAQSGMSDDVIVSYIRNSAAPFSLSADQIVYLKDVGLSSQAITEMLSRDQALGGQAPQAAPAAAPAPVALPAPAAPAPPPTAAAAPAYVSSPPADVTYFYNDLAPYGSWVDLPGYGWCWQPTVVVSNRGWRPYCDAGHWVYTDAGWCWVSDYSWGWAPFHYGRWYLHDRCGWVWLPDRVWGPAWVTWRSVGDQCGWAPLPPHADFDIRLGWRFNGVRVGLNFDFGLHENAFAFIGMKNFCDRDLRSRCLAPTEVTRIYKQTTIINNYVVSNNRIVNQGIKVDRVSAATHTQIRMATIRDLPAGSARGARVQGSDKSGLVVYRPQLQAPAKPAKMVAQKFDERHPTIQHTEMPATQANRRAQPAVTRSAPAAAPRAAQQEPQRATPRASAAKPASSGANYSTPRANQPAPAAQPSAAARSAASYQAAPAAAPSRTARPATEVPRGASRQIPNYRPTAAAPTYPLRMAEQTPASTGGTAAKGQSSHDYAPKSARQAAEVHALPPLNPREGAPSSSEDKNAGSRSKNNR